MTRAFPGRRFGADDDARFAASQDTPVELCVHRRQWDDCDECQADHEAEERVSARRGAARERELDIEAELVALELAALEKVRRRENG